MHSNANMKRYLLAVMAIITAACAGDIDAPSKQDGLLGLSAPAFIRFQSDAYSAAEKSASFWAVPGQQRSVALRYTDTNDEYLRFTVGPNSLRGDSVLITVTAANDGTMRFNFEPSGLQFAEPAVLRINADRSNMLPLLAPLASIWRQNFAWAPWIKLPTINLFGDVVQTDVEHFTDFGMAVN